MRLSVATATASSAAFGGLDEQLTWDGQARPSVHAFEQAHAERALELSLLLAHGRLGQSQSLGGDGDASAIGNLQQGAKLPNAGEAPRHKVS
jgi:hypothetical protein